MFLVKLDQKQLLVGLSIIQRNGLGADAEMWLPDLESLNQLRAELGHEPLSRDQVPDNIHFASELERCSED